MGKDIRDAVFDEVYEVAKENKDVVFLSADADAFSLRKFKKDFPDRFINVGVSEQNMVDVAAGLSLCGKKVFICAIIPFITLRCYEQIKVNICSMKLPVFILGIGAGLSFGFDGPTHHAVCDIPVMRTLPELSIYNPSDPKSCIFSVRESVKYNRPSYIRIDKGSFESFNSCFDDCSIRIISGGDDICILSTGILSHRALKISEYFRNVHKIDIKVVDLCQISPLCNEKFSNALKSSRYIFVLEENIKTGGIFDLICAYNENHGISQNIIQFSLPDCQTFIYGERDYLHEYYNIDEISLIKKIKYVLDIR